LPFTPPVEQIYFERRGTTAEIPLVELFALTIVHCKDLDSKAENALDILHLGRAYRINYMVEAKLFEKGLVSICSLRIV
jgi:hypothetical protein